MRDILFYYSVTLSVRYDCTSLSFLISGGNCIAKVVHSASGFTHVEIPREKTRESWGQSILSAIYTILFT
jgi:hypothetical protein